MNPEIPSPEQPKRIEKKETGLTPEEMRLKLLDPSFLPSYGELSEMLKPYKRNVVDKYSDPEWRQWEALCTDPKHPVFEFWTQEYIRALGTYLATRVEELGGNDENPIVILEVGAGNGRLAHFLQEKNERTDTQQSESYSYRFWCVQYCTRFSGRSNSAP